MKNYLFSTSIICGSIFLSTTMASAQDTAAPAKPAAGHATKAVEGAAKAVDDASTKAAETGSAAKAEATGKVKKKVIKAKAAVEGEEGSASSFGGGSKQEPKPGPYSSELTASFSFASESQSQTVGDNDSTKISGTSMELSTTYQFILGHFSVGPIFSYATSSKKSTPPEPSVVSTTGTTTTGLGIAAQFFISDINTERLVPFVGFDYQLTGKAETTKAEGLDDTKKTASGNKMNLQAGVEYFLARHVTFKPALSYQTESSTTKTADDDASTTKDTQSNIRVVAGLAILL